MRKVFSIFAILLSFILLCVYIVNQEHLVKVTEVKSPVDFLLSDGEFVLKGVDSFDSEFTDKNLKLSNKLNITEQEAFVMGNLAKYWTQNLMENRFGVLKQENDLVYLRNSYYNKFLYSGYCLKDEKPYSKASFDYRISKIRKADYKVYDLDSENVYELTNPKIKRLKHFVVVRKSQLRYKTNKFKKSTFEDVVAPKSLYDAGDIKIILTDFTKNLKPNHNCNTLVCKSVVSNINNSKDTIDMAIYGYSKIPDVEIALKNAQKRGVKIRLVYDLNSNGTNIYSDTERIVEIIAANKSDMNSKESNNLMHNKFMIFDNKITIVGSANLSHTDMSEFNSNAVAVIDSVEVANIYRHEFEQMFSGKFHNAKSKSEKNKILLKNAEISVYFSPQDKTILSGILPLINNAKKYIYIPTFLITEKNMANALIDAHNRGVDVKIITDALNAGVKHSKHELLRKNGLLVKAENYAGKLHSKSMIIDDTYTIIGSMNFSNSGANKNDENLMIIKDKNIAILYKKFFLYHWDKIDNKWLKYNPRSEGKDSIGSCTDGIDNNYDGFTDLDDPACK